MTNEPCQRCQARPPRAPGKTLCEACAVCSKCSTTEAEKYELLNGFMVCVLCKTAAVVQARIDKAGFYPIHRGVTLANLYATQRLIAGDYTAAHRAESLFLRGESGVGKSYTAAAILRTVIERGATGRWVNIPWLFATLRDQVKTPGFEMTKRVNALVELDYLVLDDLGANRASDWGVEVMYLVLDQREARDTGGLIVTSNLSLEEIAKNYGDRIASRITNGARIVNMTGEDLRRRRAQKSETGVTQ